MQSDFVYRGRTVRAQDIEFIGRLIADHPTLSRRRLSAKLCAAWNWVQPNGRPRDMVARSLMLELHRVGHIQLPAPRFRPPNNAAQHRAPAGPTESTRAPLACSLVQLPGAEMACASRFLRHPHACRSNTAISASFTKSRLILHTMFRLGLRK
jgi:hypothetical protein